jgi:hypothetical protein
MCKEEGAQGMGVEASRRHIWGRDRGSWDERRGREEKKGKKRLVH